MRASLAGAALASLDASGQFPLADFDARSRYTEIDAGQAVTLARAWIHEFGAQHYDFLVRTHGGPIVVRSLAPCGRPLYARAAFQPPDPSMPAALRRVYGAWWLVTFCDGGQPQVSVAVAAWNDELRVVNYSLRFPSSAGNEFFGIGIPAGHAGEYPASPEAAAALVASQTGRHVAGVPELVMVAPDAGFPQTARWLMPLDVPAQVRGDVSGLGARDRVAVQIAHPERAGVATAVALPAQPEGIDVQWLSPPGEHELWSAYIQRRHPVAAHVSRRADTPIRFERATGAGGQ